MNPATTPFHAVPCQTNGGAGTGVTCYLIPGSPVWAGSTSCGLTLADAIVWIANPFCADAGYSQLF